jgi:hypothetical protein
MTSDISEEKKSCDYAENNTTQHCHESNDIPVLESPAADTKSEPPKQKSWYQKPNNWIRLLTLIFVAFYTVMTFEALIAGNRAIVYFDKATFETIDQKLPPESNGKITVFNLPISAGKAIFIRFSLTNSGNTATRNMRAILDCRPIPYGDKSRNEPFSLFHWDDKIAVPEIIGPKQTIEIGPCGATPEAILNAQMGIAPIYLMGEIRYQDRVIPWAQHVTQFSQEMAVLEFDTHTATIIAKTRGVGRHNCADEDCPAE